MTDNTKLLWDLASGVVDYWIENYTVVTMESVFSRSNRRPDREARMAIMFVAKELLGCSYAEIGRFLHRDRSTVLRAIASVSKTWDTEERYLLIAAIKMHMLDSQFSEVEVTEDSEKQGLR